MGGTTPAVLGLLCLAVLPGFAQEVSTNQSADLGTEVPAAATISSIVNSTFPPGSGSVVSELSAVPRGGEDNELIAVTDPPPSTIAVSESDNETSAITEAPQETSSLSGGTASSQEHTDPETGGATRPRPTQPSPTTHTLTASEDGTTGTSSSLTATPLLPSSPAPRTQNDSEVPPGSAQPADTTSALRADWTSPTATDLLITSAVTTAPPTSPATQTAATPHTSRPEGQRDPSQLEVGDHKEIPGLHSVSGSNPLFVMIVSVFTVMVVMVVVAVGFHRYKKRNRRTDFRRLQDLPMDDMMEDTPLALYSY